MQDHEGPRARKGVIGILEKFQMFRPRRLLLLDSTSPPRSTGSYASLNLEANRTIRFSGSNFHELVTTCNLVVAIFHSEIFLFSTCDYHILIIEEDLYIILFRFISKIILFKNYRNPSRVI